MAGRRDYEFLGPLFGLPATAAAMTRGGLFHDLLVVPLLLHPRTRRLGILWSLAFHGLNKLLFSIGVFPEMALALSIVFLDPAWPRCWLHWDPPAPDPDAGGR